MPAMPVPKAPVVSPPVVAPLAPPTAVPVVAPQAPPTDAVPEVLPEGAPPTAKRKAVRFAEVVQQAPPGEAAQRAPQAVPRAAQQAPRAAQQAPRAAQQAPREAAPIVAPRETRARGGRLDTSAAPVWYCSVCEQVVLPTEAGYVKRSHGKCPGSGKPATRG